jgi:CrcB protein
VITYLWVAIGGALGSVARFAVGNYAAQWHSGGFPWGTLIVNVTGSFVIGLFAALTGPGGRWPVSLDSRQFFMVGICGGYTTFSSFSLQTLDLARDGHMTGAATNIGLSLVGCLGACWLGYLAANALNRG